MKMSHYLLHACVIGALMLASYQSAVATETPKDVSKELSDLPTTATSVDLYLGARDATYRYDLSESDVLRMGCHYRTQTPGDTRELLNVLMGAGWVVTPPLVHGYDARIVVHIHQGSSRYVSLTMTPDYSNAFASGSFYVGPRSDLTRDIYVEAHGKVERDLRFWASQHESLVVRPSCNFH
jgi:hypothetical protein